MASNNQQRTLQAAKSSFSGDDVRQGAVLWLPQRSRRTASVKQTHPPRMFPKPGPHRHPILVLSHPAEKETEIHFVVLTSLGDTRGKQEESDPRIQRCPKNHYYLPIEPSEQHKCYTAHPVLVEYRGEESAATKGYVSFEAVYSMEWAQAVPYVPRRADDTKGEGPWRLTAESMNRVLD